MAPPVKIGLLGNGIGRSRARHLHELIGTLLDLPVSYVPMDLEGRAGVAIATELVRCEREGFAGVNVTHPYKSDAFHAVARTLALPRGLTAVNTVVFANGGSTGCNTDYTGFQRAYRDRFGKDARPGRVLMAGAGGVGKAIAFALGELGAGELIIHDTQPGAIAALLGAVGGCGLPARAASGDLAAEMRAVDGLINATPVGMFQYPGCVFPLNGMNGQAWAFDAVYTPENTEFVAACSAAGIATLSGFRLFLYQGLDAWERFTGTAADAGVIERAFLERYPLQR